jgi:cobalt transporter subunit CbtB
MNATTGRIDQAVVAAQAASAGRTGLAALVAVLLGAFILLGVGFAKPATLHNAAHDARHAFVFPCH